MILNDFAQNILSKLNNIISNQNDQDTKLDTINNNTSLIGTNAGTSATQATAAANNTATNNTASSTGTLSQKLSYIINLLGNNSNSKTIEPRYTHYNSTNLLWSKTGLSYTLNRYNAQYYKFGTFIPDYSGTFIVQCNSTGTGGSKYGSGSAPIYFLINYSNYNDRVEKTIYSGSPTNYGTGKQILVGTSCGKSGTTISSTYVVEAQRGDVIEIVALTSGGAGNDSYHATCSGSSVKIYGTVI